MNKDSSASGKDMKYAVALVALLFVAGSLPTVQAAIQAQALANDPVAQTGAAIFSFLGFGSSSPAQRPKDEMRASSSPGLKLGLLKAPGISPQDVVTLLYKNGFISADKIDAARRLIASSSQQRMPEQGRPVGESDHPPLSGGEGWHASTTNERPMPPRPPMMKGQGERR